MKTFSYSLTASIKKIKKTHKRTKAVSWIYAIGFIILTVLAFFPTVNVQFTGKGKLFIGTFFWPLVNIFKKNINVIDLIVMALYIAMAAFMIIYFFKGITRFGKILRRTSGNVTTCNKNLAIMEEIADAFSGALASYVIFNLVIYMITYATKSTSLFGAITLWAVIALAVSLIVHFWAGVLGAKVSVFIIGSTIEEKKREDKLFPFFLRNLIQVIGIAAILYFFAPATNFYIELGNLFAEGKTSALTDFSNLFAFLSLVLQVGVVATSIVLIKHATAMTEYNRIGMDGIGMRNFRIFGIITTVLCVALFIFDTTDGTQMNYLYAAIAGLVATVLDFLVKPKVVKPVEDDPMLRKYKEKALEDMMSPEQQQQTAAPQMQNCCLYARPCYPTGVTPQQQAAKAEETKSESANNESEENNTTTEENVTNTNNYYNMMGGVAAMNGNGMVNGLPDGLPPQAPTIMEVKCPFCEKLLSVKDSTPYHRCPSCGKVFQIRKGQKVASSYSAPEAEVEGANE